VWRRGLEVPCCGSSVLAVGSSRSSLALCTSAPVSPRRWMSQDRPSPATHSPSPFRYSWVVGASARGVQW